MEFATARSDRWAINAGIGRTVGLPPRIEYVENVHDSDRVSGRHEVELHIDDALVGEHARSEVFEVER
jgi:hypothetical protein